MFNSEGFVNPGIGYSRQIEGLEYRAVETDFVQHS
jgi:hypothetical protein